MKFMGDDSPSVTMIAQYDSNIQMSCDYYLLLLTANGFSFLRSRGILTECVVAHPFPYFPF